VGSNPFTGVSASLSFDFSPSFFSADVYRRGVYISGGVNPTDGTIYAGDPVYTSYFPVVRQGRYMNYGFYEVPDTLSTLRIPIPPLNIGWPARMGKTFFINLVYRMSLY